MTAARLCKDDLLLVPPRLHKILGRCSPLLLCTKVASIIHLLDVLTFRKITLKAIDYFPHEPYAEFFPLHRYTKKFLVVDEAEQLRAETSHTYPVSTIAVLSETDSQPVTVKTHLKLDFDSEVLGFDLAAREEFEAIRDAGPYLLVKTRLRQHKAKGKK